MAAYLATSIISIVPNLVLFLIPDDFIKSSRGGNYLLCFSAGALLGDVFLHTLPHLLLEEHDDHEHDSDEDPHKRALFIGGTVLAGFILFMLSERLIGIFVHSHHDHKHDDPTEEVAPVKGQLGAQGWLNLAADALHNFQDGIAMGVSYKAGKSLGFATLISIFFHEIPHEFADFTILVTNGLSKGTIICPSLH